MAEKKSEAEKKTADRKAANEQEKKHDHYGHRQRLKNRFLREGLYNFEDHNILELLLFFSIPQRDTNEIAHRLMNEFGSLSGVFDASPEELVKVKGISDNSATLIVMMNELFKAYSRDRVKRSELNGRKDFERYVFEQLRNEKVEKIMLICLDNCCRRIHDVIISDGTANFAGVDKRKIAEILLRHNSTGAVIAHNHPSGFAVPSNEDIEMTVELRNVLSSIGVLMVDHIIVSPEDCMSLSQSERYSPIFDKTEW